MGRKLLYSLFWVALICITILSLRKAVSLPFTLDETLETTAGIKINQIGPRTFLPVPEGNIEISHPFLYTYSHALVSHFFGYTEFPLRMYGIVLYFLSLFLIFLIINEAIEEDALFKKRVYAMTATLYLLNPLLLAAFGNYEC